MSNQDWRPGDLPHYVGQEKIKGQLITEIKASKLARRPLRNIIFDGPGGLGKTTLSAIIAAERNVPLVKTYGKACTHEHITEILLNLPTDGHDPKGFLKEPAKALFPVILIDEAQKMPHEVMELLHGVLEPGDDGRRIYLAKRKEGSVSQTAPKWAPACSFIWITNYLGEIAEKSAPTLSRFQRRYTFEYYTDHEIQKVIHQFALVNDVTIEDDAISILANRANGMPREAVTLLKLAQDEMIASGNTSIIDVPTVTEMLGKAEIDEHGLNAQMRKVLYALAGSTAGKLSLATLQATVDIDESTLLYCIEPVLLKRGLITRTSGGREITRDGRAITSGSNAMSSDPFESHSI